MAVTISLHGLKRGVGYIILVYEGTKWGDALKEYSESKEASDASAL